MTRLWLKPAILAAGMTGGLLAGALFKQVWKLVADDDDTPEATDADRGWGEVFAAAALHGAIFGLARAAVDRGSAAGVARLTGSWPS